MFLIDSWLLNGRREKLWPKNNEKLSKMCKATPIDGTCKIDSATKYVSSCLDDKWKAFQTLYFLITFYFDFE
jgi:hypothetical protein